VSDSPSDSPEIIPGSPEGAPPAPEETPSAPIDVTELLATTRQLFAPEEIDKAMEVSGYEPPASVEDGGEGADNNAVDATPDSTLESGDDTPDEAKIVGEDDTQNVEDDTADDSVEEKDSEQEKTSRKHRGLNVLAVVSLVLAIALSPLALLFGYIALGQSRRAGQRGEQLALWAIGLGWLVFAGWLILAGSLVWIGVERGITLESLSEFIEFFSVP
jgi:hypothetical protein